MSSQLALVPIASGGCSGFEQIEFESRPIPINQILSQNEWFRLARWMHNGNGPCDYVMGITDKTGSRYLKAKNRGLSHSLHRSWQSITEAVPRPFAVATYSSNLESLSCWACIDIDAHDPASMEHGVWLSKKLIDYINKHLIQEQLTETCLIVEKSGRGFHIFFIAGDFLPSKEWHQRIARLLCAAFSVSSPKNEILKGIECFPGRLISPGKMGHAVRLPGTANVNTWRPGHGPYEISKIIAHFGLGFLLQNLPEEIECNQRGLSSFSYTPEETQNGKPNNPKQAYLLELRESIRLLEAHSIKAPSTRHKRLLGLVGEGFFHFGRKTLRLLAEHQYLRAQCRPQSLISEHLAEFEKAYDGMLESYPSRLNPCEIDAFNRLKPLAMREAFIIAQNFARYGHATRRNGADGRFPLSAPELATRLGFKMAYGDMLRRNLVALGVMEKVASGRAPRIANMYRWLLFESKEASPHPTPL